MVLHRNPDAAGYTAEGTIIDISFDPSSRTWWLSVPLLSYLPEAEKKAWQSWRERNDLHAQRFQRLGEAREYLQALVDLDPPPPACISIQAQRRRLRRQPDGSYQIQGLPDLKVVADPRKGGWTILGPKGEMCEQVRTLAMLCDLLHILDRNYARRTDTLTS